MTPKQSAEAYIDKLREDRRHLIAKILEGAGDTQRKRFYIDALKENYELIQIARDAFKDEHE